MAAAMQITSMSGVQTRLTKGAFTGTQLRQAVVPRVQRSAKLVTKATQSTEFPSNWLNKNPIVPVLGFFGWTVPTNIPVPVLGGKSLFGEFLASIGSNLAHFPTGPALSDPFWVYFAIYHVGLFTALLLGQIGVNGRKQGYW